MEFISLSLVEISKLEKEKNITVLFAIEKVPDSFRHISLVFKHNDKKKYLSVEDHPKSFQTSSSTCKINSFDVKYFLTGLMNGDSRFHEMMIQSNVLKNEKNFWNRTIELCHSCPTIAEFLLTRICRSQKTIGEYLLNIVTILKYILVTKKQDLSYIHSKLAEMIDESEIDQEIVNIIYMLVGMKELRADINLIDTAKLDIWINLFASKQACSTKMKKPKTEDYDILFNEIIDQK